MATGKRKPVSKITTVRLREADLVALREVSERLGLDATNTLRALIHAKHRELGRAAKPRKSA